MHPAVMKKLQNDSTMSQFSITPFSDGFFYLGTWLGQNVQSSNILQRNFQLNDSLLLDALKLLPVKTLSLSGRILQVKALAASQFVYKFMLLPSPSKKFLASLDKLYFDYIWEGRHKMSKEKMCLPRTQGGFNMLNVYIQEQSLKLSWMNRFLCDTSCITYTQNYLFSSSIIPFPDFMKGNLAPKNFCVLLTNKPPPPFIHDILHIWFTNMYVPRNCTDPSKRDVVLNSLFCFNEGFDKVFNFTTHKELYYFLSENGILTVSQVICNVWEIRNALLHMKLNVNLFDFLLRECSKEWSILIGKSAVTEHNDHIIDKCIQNLMPAKAFYSWLINKTGTNIFDKTISIWSADIGFDNNDLKQD